jgi:hypothetical protein
MRDLTDGQRFDEPDREDLSVLLGSKLIYIHTYIHRYVMTTIDDDDNDNAFTDEVDGSRLTKRGSTIHVNLTRAGLHSAVLGRRPNDLSANTTYYRKQQIIHTYIHTYIIHTFIHTYILYTHAYCICTHTCIHTYIHTHIHTI